MRCVNPPLTLAASELTDRCQDGTPQRLNRRCRCHHCEPPAATLRFDGTPKVSNTSSYHPTWVLAGVWTHMMRNSFLEPVAELDLAAKLLDAATDALLIGDRKLAANLVSAADRSEILRYTLRIVSSLSDEVHRQTKLRKALPKDARDPSRMPSKEVQYSIFWRDGWRCRYCGIKVISTTARKKLVEIFPEQTKWVAKEFQRHSSLYAMAASLDHIVPHSRGGKNEIENFVTACYCCQFGRGNFTLEEVQFNNPLQRPPVITTWDGLTRLETYKGAS